MYWPGSRGSWVCLFSEDTGLSPDLLCFYPHGDTVVLGGTAIDSEGILAPDDKAAADILVRCAEVEPRLAQARVLEHRIGARPPRATIPCGEGPLGGRHPDCAQLWARRQQASRCRGDAQRKLETCFSPMT